jgi:hypothetical protein
VNSADQTNVGYKGAIIIARAAVLTPTVVLTVQGKVPTVSEYYDIATFTMATTVTGTYTLFLYPGMAETITNSFLFVQSLILPDIWRVVLNPDAATAYTVGVHAILLS